MHRLEEAERHRRRRLIENAFVKSSSIIEIYPEELSTSRTKSIGVDGKQEGLQFDSRDPVGGISHVEEKKAPLLVSDLVKIDTKKLRNKLPEESRENLFNREQRIRQRRVNRKKALSDGVAAMRAWNHHQDTNNLHEKKEGKQRQRSRIRKTASQPGVIQGWQKITAFEEQKNIPRSLDDTDATRVTKERKREKSNSDPPMVQAWKESLLLENEKGGDLFLSKDRGPAFVRKGGESSEAGSKDLTLSWKKEGNERLAARKRTRKKAQSASAVIQSWRDYSINEVVEQKSDTLAEENFNSGDLQDLSSDELVHDKIFAPKLSGARYDEGEAENESSIFQNQLSLHTLIENEVHEELSTQKGDMHEVVRDGKTLIDLSEVIIEKSMKDCNEDDDGTVETGKSVGNLSDVDVIQAESVGMSSLAKKAVHGEKSNVPFQRVVIQKARQYFSGPVYQNTSHVLGTSLVFYLVGHVSNFFGTVKLYLAR